MTVAYGEKNLRKFPIREKTQISVNFGSIVFCPFLVSILTMAAEVATKVSEILGTALCDRVGSVILDYIVSTPTSCRTPEASSSVACFSPPDLLY